MLEQPGEGFVIKVIAGKSRMVKNLLSHIHSLKYLSLI